jgi:hypothetical protein
MGATEIEPMTSTVSSTLQALLNKDLRDFSLARFRKTAQIKSKFRTLGAPRFDRWFRRAISSATGTISHHERLTTMLYCGFSFRLV